MSNTFCRMGTEVEIIKTLWACMSKRCASKLCVVWFGAPTIHCWGLMMCCCHGYQLLHVIKTFFRLCRLVQTVYNFCGERTKKQIAVVKLHISQKEYIAGMSLNVGSDSF